MMLGKIGSEILVSAKLLRLSLLEIVSVFMENYIYFTLSRPISCELICNRLNALISSVDTENTLIEIGIKNISTEGKISNLGYINSEQSPNLLEYKDE